MKIFCVIIGIFLVSSHAFCDDDQKGSDEDLENDIRLFKLCQQVTGCDKYEETYTSTTIKDGAPAPSKRQILKQKQKEEGKK